MEYINSIILGTIQGLTEFLPISSSGHLVLLHDIFKIEMTDNLAFDVFLHFGTLIALVIFFYKDIIRYLAAFLKSLAKWNLKNDLDQRISWLIFISMIPAGLIGYFFGDIIENIFRSPLIVAIVLILVSFLFFIAEKYSKKEKDLVSLTWLKGLIIGLAQAVALIPGVSRSGITIVTGMAYDLKREAAARFSFLISIPIVFAAAAKETIDLAQTQIAAADLIVYALGFLSSAIVGYFCIKYLLKFLQSHSLNIFAYYRIVLGIIIIIYLIV